MDQIKIGKFIKNKRKEKNLTQSELAFKLNVTDRAVSKWENGICMPDSSIIDELCKILKITINDLFSGEIVDIKNNEKRLEKNLLEIAKQKEESDKRLLCMEILLGLLSVLPILISLIIVMIVPLDEKMEIIITCLSVIPVLIILPFMLRIEQTAGYYECRKCGYRYIPTYKSVFFATHINRTRHMRCPKCNKKSWNRKVLSKN